MSNKTHVPFGADGWMVRNSSRAEGSDWIPAEPFTAALKFHRYYIGAAARMVLLWDDSARRGYYMDMDEFFKHLDFVEDGRLTTQFKFKKKGAYWRLQVAAKSPLEFLAASAEAEEDV